MKARLREAPLRPVTALLHWGGLTQRQIPWEHSFSVGLKVLQAANKALLAQRVVGHWITSTSNVQVQEGMWDESSATRDRGALQADTCITRVMPEL